MPDDLSFDEDDLAPAADIISELARTGTGWVNFSPEVDPEYPPPPRNMVVAIFSNRGEPVPLATWTAPEAPGRPALVGLQHGAGPGALARLAEHHLELRPGWSKLSDHARRGLVLTVPVDEDPTEIVWWLLAASHALSPVPLTGAWLASVHRP